MVSAAIVALMATTSGLLIGRAVAECPTGMSCLDVNANGLTFQCVVAVPVAPRLSVSAALPTDPMAHQGTPSATAARKRDVLLLHGFPEWVGMFPELMGALQTAGYRSAACNQRG